MDSSLGFAGQRRFDWNVKVRRLVGYSDNGGEEGFIDGGHYAKRW